MDAKSSVTPEYEVGPNGGGQLHNLISMNQHCSSEPYIAEAELTND